MEINAKDLVLILARHQGDQIFRQTLDKIERADQLLVVVGRYVEFNAPFVAGVASLAGSIAARRELFADEYGRERSVEVARHILDAAIDEFGDRTLPTKPSHRALAQTFLEETAEILGYGLDRLKELARPTDATQRASQKGLKGYGVNQIMDERCLFHAIGFHMGGEMLTEKEFRLLDAFLRQRYADLVSKLERRNAYFWIQRHTHVEAEHFDSALHAANLALGYYVGEGKNRIRERILEGFDEYGLRPRNVHARPTRALA